MAETREPRLALRAVRYVLPAVLAVAGAVIWATADSEEMRTLGTALVGTAAIAVAANLFIRLSLASNTDREREALRRQRRGQTIGGAKEPGTQAGQRPPPERGEPR